MNSSENRSQGWRGTLAEHLAYGIGTLLLAVGPVLAGMDMVAWMAVYMGLNALILIAICLVGAWFSSIGRTRRRR